MNDELQTLQMELSAWVYLRDTNPRHRRKYNSHIKDIQLKINVLTQARMTDLRQKVANMDY
jgi:hypothetical protein